MTVLDEDEVFITTDLHVTFHRLIKDGALQFEGKIVQREKRSAHAEVVITDEDGLIVAEADAKEIIRRIRQRI
jgi:acyl-coenzyme A thioesterase PaaI-like protein